MASRRQSTRLAEKEERRRQLLKRHRATTDSDSDSSSSDDDDNGEGREMVVQQAQALVMAFDEFKEFQRQKVKEREPVILSAKRKFKQDLALSAAIAVVLWFIKVFSVYLEPALVKFAMWLIPSRFKLVITLLKAALSLSYIGLAWGGFLICKYVYERMGMHPVDETDDTKEIFTMYRKSGGAGGPPKKKNEMASAMLNAVPHNDERDLRQLERKANAHRRKNKKRGGCCGCLRK